MKSLTKNTIANLSSRLWSMVSVYLFLPIFLSILGEEQYGLMTFFSTLQAALNLLGMGLSGTLRREFATIREDIDRREKWKLLRSVEVLYIAIALIIVVICFSGSTFIANRWLNYRQLTTATIQNTIGLMGISIATQLFCNLWHGCLLGLGNQVTANVINICWSALRNIFAIVAVIIVRNISVVYIAYLCVDILYAFVVKTVLIRITLKKQCIHVGRWNLSEMHIETRVLRYTFGLLSISVISLIGNQLDKVVISTYTDLTDLGAYNTVLSLASLVRIFASALSITAMTRFTQLFSLTRYDELRRLYFTLNKAAVITTLTLASFVGVFSESILRIWIGNGTSYIDIMRDSAIYLVFGVAFLALQEIPYCLMLAQGKTKPNVIMGAATIPVFAVVSIFCIQKWGVFGASVSYCAVYLFQTAAYLLIVDWGMQGWVKNIVLPIVVSTSLSVTCAYALHRLLEGRIGSPLSVVFIAVIAGCLALGVLFVIFFKGEIRCGLLGGRNK